MHQELEEIPSRILSLAIAALTQANMHAVFMDPGTEHWKLMSVLNTAHAGELFLKAIIAREHPLLIFKDIFSLDDHRSDTLDIEILLKKGRTHDFEKLPQVLWVATGQRIPDLNVYEQLRHARNAIQHFCAPEGIDCSAVSLKFIYEIIDPLIYRNFGIHAIEYHEDFGIGYDYVVATLLRSELKFTIPNSFDINEVRLEDEIQNASIDYKNWFYGELSRLNKLHLL